MDINKHQINIYAGQQSYSLRTDDVTDIASFLGIKEGVINASIIADYLKKLNNNINSVEIKVIKEEPAECQHKNTKKISGTTAKGNWEGLKCNSCGKVNFKNHAKDGGEFWTGWKEAKK